VESGDRRRFAGRTGDTNPIHLDEIYASEKPFHCRIAHKMLSASNYSGGA
jgi:3-hydroxybutyryl-CoA dehydratase